MVGDCLVALFLVARLFDRLFACSIGCAVCTADDVSRGWQLGCSRFDCAHGWVASRRSRRCHRWCGVFN